MADIGHRPLTAYVGALDKLCTEWIHGSHDDATPPGEEEGSICLDYLDNYGKQCDTSEMEAAYQELRACKVQRHLDQAASHRRWLNLWYKLITIADIDVEDDLKDVVKVHDLSKYGPYEVLGYGIMFGETGRFKLLAGREKELWDLALKSHYSSNPHHPQYQVGVAMDGVHLEESVLDMLASRSERTLLGESCVTPSQLMDVPEMYLTRYVPQDKDGVRVKLAGWLQKVEGVVNDRGGDAAEVIGHWEELSGKTLLMHASVNV